MPPPPHDDQMPESGIPGRPHKHLDAALEHRLDHHLLDLFTGRQRLERPDHGRLVGQAGEDRVRFGLVEQPRARSFQHDGITEPHRGRACGFDAVDDFGRNHGNAGRRQHRPVRLRPQPAGSGRLVDKTPDVTPVDVAEGRSRLDRRRSPAGVGGGAAERPNRGFRKRVAGYRR